MNCKRKSVLSRCLVLGSAACFLASASQPGQGDEGNALQTTPAEMVRQMHLPHEAVPYGVPASYSWRSQPVVDQGGGPPSSFHAITGWGQIFRADSAAPANFRVSLRHLRTYVLTASGTLELVQSSSAMDGANFRPDYKDNLHEQAQITHDAQGNTVVTTQPYSAFHFWPAAGKVGIDPRAVRGVLVAVEARIEPEPGLKAANAGKQLLLSVGADYWLAENSEWDRYLTNVGIGLGRFAYLDTHWKCYTMTTITSGDAAKLSTPIQC